MGDYVRGSGVKSRFSDAEMAEKTPRWSLREFFRYTLRPWQEPEVPAPPGINTKPCGCASSSALRADIARFFYALRCIGQDYVRGALSP